MNKWLALLASLLTVTALWGQGYLFTTQTPVYPNDSIEFRFLCIDPQGMIYLGTNKGLFFYNGREPLLVVDDNLTAGNHTGKEILLGNENGMLLVVETKGFGTLSREVISDSSAISDIQISGDQKIIGTQGEGIFISNQTAHKQVNSENGLLRDNFVYQLEIYDDDIWVATDRGVDRLTPGLQKNAHYATPGLTKSLTQTSTGIFFAGYASGVSMYSADSGMVYSIDERSGIDKLITIENELFALENGSLSYLENGLWHSIGNRSDIVDIIATPYNNLVTLHSNGDIGFADLSFRHFHLDLEGEITALLQSGKQLFLASQGSVIELDLRTGARERIASLGKDVVIVDLSLIETKLYCATFNRGLLELDLKTSAISLVEGLPDESVLSLARADDQSLWISTLSGLSKYLPGKDAVLVDLGGEFPSTYIYKLYFHEGSLWLGTDGDGVFKYTEGKLEKIPTQGHGTKNSVYDITSDREQNIYAISLQNGAMKLNEKPLVFHPSGVFQSQNYSSFGVTDQGDYLICTDNELYLARGSLTRRFSETYFPNKLSGAYIHTFSDSADPWLYFASGSGVYAYRSGGGTFETPSLILSEWEVNYSRQATDQTRLASHEDNHVFKFATSSYRVPDNQQIEVRLIGYEREFRTVASREVNYPKLPPGDYTLQARVSENGLVCPEIFELLEFKIAIPFYFQWWFILLSVLFLAGLIYAILRFRMNRLNQIRLAEQKLLESELSLLRNQVNPHFLFNSFNTLMNLIEQAPAEANEYLQRLSDFYRRMLEKQENQVVTVKEELIIAREYCYLQKKRFRDSFIFTENFNVELENTRIPVLTLQLLIENAIKHNVISRNQPLEIILENRDGYLCLKNKIVSKRDPVKGTGMGLENIRKRYSSIFQLDIKVEKNNGWFEVFLPIVN